MTDQEKKVKREIEIPENFLSVLNAVNAEIMQLQSQINVRREKVLNLITGLLLKEGVDINQEGAIFSKDGKTLEIIDLPEVEEEEKETSIPKKAVAKRRNIKE